MLREIVELFISKGYIKILFCTDSFSVGLNCPIKTSDKFKKVSIITGNHEYYQNDIIETNEKVHEICCSRNSSQFVSERDALTGWSHTIYVCLFVLSLEYFVLFMLEITNALCPRGVLKDQSNRTHTH